MIRLLLERADVEINWKDTKYGQTPLSWATRNGHEAVVELLLAKNGVDSDSKDSHRLTPLSWAARAGHAAVVKLLLDKGGVNINSKDYSERTPLLWAAREGHAAVVKLLLAQDGVDPSCKDIYNLPPLWWAVAKEHEAVVKLLAKDDNGRRPLLLWSKRQEYKPFTGSSFDAAYNLACTSLPGAHPLSLSVALDYATFLWNCQNNYDRSRAVARKATKDSYMAPEDLTDDEFIDASEIVYILARMQKRENPDCTLRPFEMFEICRVHNLSPILEE
jgi:hypothetical protein